MIHSIKRPSHNAQSICTQFLPDSSKKGRVSHLVVYTITNCIGARNENIN